MSLSCQPIQDPVVSVTRPPGYDPRRKGALVKITTLGLAAALALAGTVMTAPRVHAQEHQADHHVIPAKLKEAGFIGDYKEALQKAKKEGKVILLYVPPSWFT